MSAVRFPSGHRPGVGTMAPLMSARGGARCVSCPTAEDLGRGVRSPPAWRAWRPDPRDACALPSFRRPGMSDGLMPVITGSADTTPRLPDRAPGQHASWYLAYAGSDTTSTRRPERHPDRRRGAMGIREQARGSRRRVVHAPVPGFVSGQAPTLSGDVGPDLRAPRNSRRRNTRVVSQRA